VLSGTGKITVGENEYVAQENNFYLTHKGVTHSLESKGKEGLRVIEIKFEMSNERLASEINKLDFCIKMSGLETRHKLEKLVQEGINKEPYYEDIINLKFLEILFSLLRYSKIGIRSLNKENLDDGLKSSINEKSYEETYLNDVVLYIKNNLDSQLNLETLSRVAKMSKYHFCRVFKTEFGITPKQYINMLRISRAKELMMYSDFNITQIAYNVGFQDVRYFSRIFKQKEKVTPLEYLKTYKPNLYFFMDSSKKYRLTQT